MNVRRNAATLIQTDPDELQKYIQGVQALKLKARPGSTISIYDELVAIHRGVASLPFDADWLTGLGVDPAIVGGLATGPAGGVDGGHRNPAFLPWHRVYLRRLEVEIQVVLDDPEASIPYWDWTDPVGSQALFVDEFLGPGGGGGEIPSGHFSGANWPVRSDLQLRPEGQQAVSLGPVLLRNDLDFNSLPDPQQVEDALSRAEYDNFRIFLEGEGQRLHDFIHGWLGGSMAMMTSPNDPIFFMHHAFIDYVWARWQRDRRAEWEADPANVGEAYDYRTHHVVPAGTPHGHNPEDPMWPWDVGASAPAIYLPTQNPFPILQAHFLTADVAVDGYSLGDRQRPVDVLDHVAMGYHYDPF